MATIDEGELRRLKSGLYNAESSLQYLKPRLVELELAVNRQAFEIAGLHQRIDVLEELVRGD